MSVTPIDIPLSEHDLLNPEEYDGIRDIVLAHRSDWNRRKPDSFYTFGTAAYLDARGGRTAEYLEKVKKTNPILMESFRPLLKKIRDFFQEMFHEKATYNQTYGLPGFHIFELNGIANPEDNPPARAHFDKQYLQAIPGYNVTEAMSFTLPIDEPTGGSCLEVWPLRAQDNPMGLGLEEYASTHPYERVAYHKGKIVVHDGFSLHAIGRGAPGATGCRITMQGHGIRTDAGWMLYW